jgi:DeoR-like helix-turn-helix domain
VPECLEKRLIHLADFVTRCRSGIVRDGYRAELIYAPEPEMPMRFVKQLFELLRGVVLVLGRQEAAAEDMDRVARVALDSIPAVRRMVLREIAEVEPGTYLKTTAIAQQAQYSTATVRRALEDLQALGVMEVLKGGEGKSDSWRAMENWTPALNTLKTVESLTAAKAKETFPETPEEAPHTTYAP